VTQASKERSSEHVQNVVYCNNGKEEPVSTDPTNYHSELPPTQAVHYNPYAPTSPYDEIPMPPPPPSQRRKRLLIALLSSACLVVLLAGVAFAILHFSDHAGSVKSTPGPTPTGIATATPTVPPYDATSIIHDFQAQGLPVDQVKYGESFAQFATNNQYTYLDAVPASSLVDFEDPTNRDPAYMYNNVWLGVYNSPGDAQAEEQRMNVSKASIEQSEIDEVRWRAGAACSPLFLKGAGT
jgi:hypothetical protein